MEKFKMPRWMEKYRSYISGTDGVKVEDYINTIYHNPGLSLAIVHQLQLLENLYNAGKIK